MRLFSQIHDYYDHQSLPQSRARTGPTPEAPTLSGHWPPGLSCEIDNSRLAEGGDYCGPGLCVIVCCQTQVLDSEVGGDQGFPLSHCPLLTISASETHYIK